VPEVTSSVLDVLAQHRVKTTFFVLGKRVITHEGRAMGERARSEGHWIGNHTYTHSTPLGELSAEAAIDEFNRTEEALAWVKQPAKLFRPFGGGGDLTRALIHPVVADKLIRDRYTCVLWNSVPKDWVQPDLWLERALKDVKTREWSLIVLHDHLANRAMDHLDEFIRRVRDDGAEIVQEFPPSCLPIVEGRVTQPFEAYIRGLKGAY
jgi:peptidoglycan-N-acetylglucosamine deacetylase